MSFEDRDEVAPANSPLSIKATRSPRIAASRATAAPLIPPPITAMSKVSLLSRAICSSRTSSWFACGGITPGRMRGHIAGLSAHAGSSPSHGVSIPTRFRPPGLPGPHQVADLDTLPPVVEPRPRRDAMEVGGLVRFRQRTNLLVRQAQRLLDQTNHAKVPLLRIKTRSRPEAQHRKPGNQILTGRKTPFQLLLRTQLRHGLIISEAPSGGKGFGPALIRVSCESLLNDV